MLDRDSERELKKLRRENEPPADYLQIAFSWTDPDGADLFSMLGAPIDCEDGSGGPNLCVASRAW